jgi:hypothetical protein
VGDKYLRHSLRILPSPHGVIAQVEVCNISNEPSYIRLETLPLVNQRRGMSGVMTACFKFDDASWSDEDLRRKEHPAYQGPKIEFSQEETESGPRIHPGQTITFSYDLTDRWVFKSGKVYAVQWDGRNSVPEVDEFVRFQAP